MGKRGCKSKYRSVPPQSPESASPKSPLLPGDNSQANDSPNLVTGARSSLGDRRSGHGFSSDRFEVSNSPDNVHSPYYLQNSDHPGLVLVSEPLDGNNYGIWLVAMTTSLEAKNKLGFLDGSIVKPLEEDQYF